LVDLPIFLIGKGKWGILFPEETVRTVWFGGQLAEEVSGGNLKNLL
jgi:hypothetical protein